MENRGETETGRWAQRQGKRRWAGTGEWGWGCGWQRHKGARQQDGSTGPRAPRRSRPQAGLPPISPGSKVPPSKLLPYIRAGFDAVLSLSRCPLPPCPPQGGGCVCGCAGSHTGSGACALSPLGQVRPPVGALTFARWQSPQPQPGSSAVTWRFWGHVWMCVHGRVCMTGDEGHSCEL